jgi:hypothetical protein
VQIALVRAGVPIAALISGDSARGIGLQAELPTGLA